MLATRCSQTWLLLLICTAACACTGEAGPLESGPPLTNPPSGSPPLAQALPPVVAMQDAPASAPSGPLSVPPTDNMPVAVDMPAQLPSTGVTYHKDIRPIMVANCATACHGPDKETRAGPLALDTYQAVKDNGELVVFDVAMKKKMPPWPQSTDCRGMRDKPSITPQQRELFVQWQQAGFPEGNPSDYVAPPADVETALGEPTRIIEMAAAITPPANTDQYLCAKIDYTFDKDTYVKAIEVIPGEKTIVHHVQVHRVMSNACTTGDNMYSWRPGGRRLTFSDGDAALIPAGSSFALQMHYNTQGKTSKPDKTKVALWELPAEQKPERVVTRVGLLANVSPMPPGTVVSSRISRAVGGPGVEIIGISPHAHMIAKHLNATLSRAGGKSECLSDVPDWSFEWQLDYIFSQPIPLAAGDTVNAVCDYDNGPDHQPTVDGVKRQQAITVTPGEKSENEMCLHYVWLRSPAR